MHQCTQGHVTGGGGSVHVWGAFCADAKCKMVVLEQNVNDPHYKDILQQHLLPWAHGLLDNNFRFQDDNAPAHRARILRDFIEGEDINVLHQPLLSQIVTQLHIFGMNWVML